MFVRALVKSLLVWVRIGQWSVKKWNIVTLFFFGMAAVYLLFDDDRCMPIE